MGRCADTIRMSRHNTLRDYSSIPEVLAAVRRVVQSVPYDKSPEHHPATFISTDPDGFPSARVLVPREYSDDFSRIKLNTRKDSRKFAEIRGEPRVALSFHDQRGEQGWLTFKCTVDAGKLRQEVYRSGGSDTCDVWLDVHKIEVMDYNERLRLDPAGWVPVV